jgi:hypothetical protein
MDKSQVRWMVKVKFGSEVMVDDISRSGGELLRQENSEGYIVVSRVSSAACRSRFSSIVIGWIRGLGRNNGHSSANDGVVAKKDGTSSGRVSLSLVAEVTGFYSKDPLECFPLSISA